MHLRDLEAPLITLTQSGGNIDLDVFGLRLEGPANALRSKIEFGRSANLSTHALQDDGPESCSGRVVLRVGRRFPAMSFGTDHRLLPIRLIPCRSAQTESRI